MHVSQDYKAIEVDAAISNPPFNLSWNPPVPLEADERFHPAGIPPPSNANYAFILSILRNIKSKASIILPNGIMNPTTIEEQGIVKYLIDNKHIEYVISLPGNMFESTSIATCILGLSKIPVEQITFIDHRQIYATEERLQRGQFGGTSHTNRVYKKLVNFLTDEMINEAVLAVTEKKSVIDYCITIPIKKIVTNEYTLQPSRYMEYEPKEVEQRSYQEITRDLRRVLSAKNQVKITCNETIARKIGLVVPCEIKCDPTQHVNELLQKNENLEGTFDKIMSLIGLEPLPKDNYLTFSKNKNEIKIENKGEGVDILIADFLRFWQIRIRQLNTEENTYLAELRDKLNRDLMSGKLEISKKENSPSGTPWPNPNMLSSF